MREAIDHGQLVATELADYLVTKGVAFRQAHDVAGGLARDATARGIELASLSPEELRKAHPAFGDDVSAWLDPARAVDRRDVVGGPARTQIVGEIDRIAHELS
jgi:argininosuccinate lyase